MIIYFIIFIHDTVLVYTVLYYMYTVYTVYEDCSATVYINVIYWQYTAVSVY